MTGLVNGILLVSIRFFGLNTSSGHTPDYDTYVLRFCPGLSPIGFGDLFCLKSADFLYIITSQVSINDF